MTRCLALALLCLLAHAQGDLLNEGGGAALGEVASDVERRLDGQELALDIVANDLLPPEVPRSSTKAFEMLSLVARDVPHQGGVQLEHKKVCHR